MRRRFFAALLVCLAVGLLVSPALALSNADYRKMMKDPEFAAADKKLNEVWVGLKKSLPKAAFEALKKDQNAWIARGRDKEANARMKQEDLSQTAAYAAVTRERAESLPGLAQRYAPSKPKPRADEKKTPANKTDARREAYMKAARAFVEEHRLPNGDPIDKDEITEDFADNRLAICDADGDGEPELLVRFQTGSMVSLQEYVCGFDEKSGKLTLKLSGFPNLEYFDNGCVKEYASHNQGLAGEFWPYSFSKYDPKKGEYELKGSVDAWSGKDFPTNHFENDKPFPKEIDAVGDGFIYYIDDEGFDAEKPVDTPVYEEWVARYISGAKLVEPDWVSADVKGLKALEKK